MQHRMVGLAWVLSLASGGFLAAQVRGGAAVLTLDAARFSQCAPVTGAARVKNGWKEAIRINAGFDFEVQRLHEGGQWRLVEGGVARGSSFEHLAVVGRTPWLQPGGELLYLVAKTDWALVRVPGKYRARLALSRALSSSPQRRATIPSDWVEFEVLAHPGNYRQLQAAREERVGTGGDRPQRYGDAWLGYTALMQRVAGTGPARGLRGGPGMLDTYMKSLYEKKWSRDLDAWVQFTRLQSGVWDLARQAPGAGTATRLSLLAGKLGALQRPARPLGAARPWSAVQGLRAAIHARLGEAAPMRECIASLQTECPPFLGVAPGIVQAWERACARAAGAR